MSKFVNIQDGHGRVVDRVDVTSPDVEITTRTITFTTSFLWSNDERYSMVFEQGKAKISEG